MKTNKFKASMAKILRMTISVLLFIAAALVFWFTLKSNDNIIILKLGKFSLSETNYVGIVSVPILLFFANSVLYDIVSDNLYIGITVVSLVLILLAAILPHIVMFFTLLYLEHKLALVLLLSLLVLGVVFLLLTFFTMRYTDYYSFLAFGRIITLSSLYLFFFLYLCLDFAFLFILFRNSFIQYSEGAYSFKLIPFSHIIEPVVLVVWVWAFFQYIVEDLRFLVYDEQRYILYLRSFTFDEEEDSISEELTDMERYMPVMKIGNPKSFFPQGVGQTFYLPKSNWKEQLDYYIQKANCVFSVVDLSEGVMWEIFEHEALSEKFIYHISDINKVKSILKNPMSEKYKCSKLIYCFKYLISKEIVKDETTFLIRNDKCYYSDISSIVRFYFGQKTQKTIPSFEIDENTAIIKVNEWDEKKNYHFLDRVSKVISYMKRRVSLIMKIVNVVSIVAILFLVINYVISKNWMDLFALIMFALTGQWMYKKFKGS